MSTNSPKGAGDRLPESAEQRKKRIGSERVGAFLLIFIGVAALISSVLAVSHDGLFAEVKLRAGDYGLPWFIIFPIGLFGVIGGIWAVLALSREH